MPRIYLSFTTARLNSLLWMSFAVLSIGNLIVLALVHRLGIGDAWGLVTLLHLDREQNLPTLFSVLLLLAASGLALLNVRADPVRLSQLTGWRIVALVLALMAIDEFASIHERVDAALRYYLGTDILPYAAWPIPYGLGVLLLAIWLWPWFIRLDRQQALHLVAAGVLYLGGAVGIELITGEYLATIDPDHLGLTDLKRDLLATVEESLELLGLIWLVQTLARSAGKAAGFEAGREEKWYRLPESNRGPLDPHIGCN